MLRKAFPILFILTLALSDSASAKALLYVTHESKGKVSVYEADSEKLIKNIQTGGSPFHLSLHPNKKQIAVSYRGVGADYLKIIDASSVNVKISPSILVGRYKKTGEIHLIFSSNGKKLYAIDSSMNYVDIIETSKWTLKKRVMLGLRPRMGMPSSDGSTIVISNLNSRNFLLFDAVKDKISRTIKTEGLPSAAAFSRDDKRIFVLDKESSLLLSVDLQSGKVIGSAVVGNEPSNLLLSPDGNTIYVANYASNSLTAVNAKTMDVAMNIAVGIQPLGMAVDDKTGRLYVCNYGEASIAIIDIKTNSVIRKIPTDITPTNLIIVRQ